ncbi:MAG: heme A synthase [Anaerolineae bacterium]|nr:heme A synthase [Anaerolineae bacterium]
MQSRLFPRLALATALLTVGLIVFGAVVRVTDSGLGCGNHWPLCNGTVIPPLDNLTAWIEWLHRLFAMLIGVFGLGTLIVAVRAYRKQNRGALTFTVIAAVLFAVQSGLGAIVVVFDLPPTFVTLHLGTAMLLLGALLVAAIVATYKQPAQSENQRDSFTTLTYITTALSLVIILTGALVRGSGATLACVDYPLCNGSVLPLDQGQLQIIHMTHRYSVAALGISLAMLVWSAWRARQAGPVRRLALLSLVMYLAQATIGALFVLTAASPLWGAAHVGFAAATWALLVALSAVETINNRTNNQPEVGWQPSSQASR